ncbi:MAG: hypothetical protein D6723_00605 [Acidobacteria bacterium]|nr:MAG: hypothetical protein D6723_00605 [Acidobacteriota bacterium]
MPFCPRCRIEYRPGFTHCSDCGVALVAELPEEHAESVPEGRVVKLAVFPTVAEAAMLKEVLEEHHIPAFVRGQTDPIGIVSGAEQVAVLVDERDAERAMKIYQSYFGHSEEAEESAAES